MEKWSDGSAAVKRADLQMMISEDDEKAAVNAPHSRRFARSKGARQSRSVWNGCVFSAALCRHL
jgi:hypothetical protein